MVHPKTRKRIWPGRRTLSPECQKQVHESNLEPLEPSMSLWRKMIDV